MKESFKKEETEKIYIVVPAKNEGERVAIVVQSILSEGFSNIIVVDDGSDDNTSEYAKSAGAKVIRHLVNLGAGAATQTGIEYALTKGATTIVTMDGDSQHFASDIPKLVDHLYNQDLDLVIGSRFLDPVNQIPLDRIIINKLANIFSGIITGLFVTDSQSGMKAIHANLAAKMHFTFDGYEFCTEILKITYQEKARFGEVPIQVQYAEELQGKGQSWKNIGKMVFRLLKYFY
ncbi:MAG: glycosyltransferase family 2 protein [Saprospiraceae bacterium]